MWLFLLACAQPTTPGSRSAILTEDIVQVGKRAEALSARAQDLEGKFDAWRAAPSPEEAEKIRLEIETEAKELAIEARAIDAEVQRIEQGAGVFPK